MKKIAQFTTKEYPFFRKSVMMTKVLKLSALFICLCCLNLPLSAFAQSKKVTIKVEQVTLKEFLQRLKTTTGVDFLYNANLFPSNEKVSVNSKDMELDQLLKTVLEPKGFTFVYNNGAVVVKRKEQSNQTADRVCGIVTNDEKEPIAGAVVSVKGTPRGTVTGLNGEYSLSVRGYDNIVLLYTFVGKKKQEIAYRGQPVLNVTLQDENVAIDDVIVTGYQTPNKISVAGSVTTLSSKDLLLNGTLSLEQELQGKVPGMMVMNRSGLTGTRQRMRIRGTSTILGNAEPVWVVDGIIQEDPLPFKSNDFNNLNQDNMDMIRDFVGSAISWLNPNDIDRVTVLKDAASTAIYGVRAANGVIVITTKKGEAGRLSVSYSGNLSYTPRMDYEGLELMNSQQRVEVSREAYEKGIPLIGGNFEIGYTALANDFRRGIISLEEFTRKAKQLEMNNTDWFDILFRNAFSHGHSVSISGGSDKATYYTSLGIQQSNNTAKGNDKTQYTASTNVSMELWHKVTLSTSLSAGLGKTNAFLGQDPYRYASTVNRAFAGYNPDGSNFFYKDATNGYQYNIQNELANSGNKNTLGNIRAAMNVCWRIVKGLNFSTSFGLGYSTSIGESWYTEQSNYIANLRGYNYDEFEEGSSKYLASPLPLGGELNQMNNTNLNWNWRNQIEYTNIFKNVHSLTVMAGQEARSSMLNGTSMRAYGYLPDRGKIMVNVPGIIGGSANKYLGSSPRLTDSKSNYMSYYMSLNYMFDSRFALNASIRTDASNRFGQDKSARYQPVWSLGARWNMGNEPWMQNQDILSDLNFRFSYGYQGNVVEGVSPDLIASIETSNSGYVLKLKDLPAPELKWEKVTNMNIGVDWSLFNNKINGSFEWYKKRTTDMVLNIEVPYENGVNSRRVNGGNMSNSGWDLSAGFVPIKGKNLILSLGFSIGKVNNQLTSRIDPNGDWKQMVTGNNFKEGYPASAFWAFKFMGLDPQHGGPTFDLSGRTGNYEKDATLYMKYAGKMEPDFTTGINFSLRYKSFSLSSGLYVSLGNQTFLAPPSNGIIQSIPSEYLNMSTEWLKRWRNPGDEKFTNVPALPNVANNANKIRFSGSSWLYPYEAYAYSDIRVVDAWYLRCGNIQLSYNIPQTMLPKLVKSIGLNCSISNPFIIRSKDFKGRDPEVALGRQPLSRTITFGANISF